MPIGFGLCLVILGSWPARAAEPSAASAGRAGIEWVRIPGGTFVMGYEQGRPEEQPAHRVKVQSFEMAKTEVTNKQYLACVAAGACAPPHVSDGKCYLYDGLKWGYGNLPESFKGDDQPALCVDWNQAQVFSKWAGGRLPSEAEWEYAARSAGQDRKYPWGDEDATCERAVMCESSNGCGRESTWPVCSKPKGNTEQGLCDMAGNAWEWVQDSYYVSYRGAPDDGRAWEGPAGSVRVSRGGSWCYFTGFLRAAARGRGGLPDDHGGGGLGFRPARSSR